MAYQEPADYYRRRDRSRQRQRDSVEQQVMMGIGKGLWWLVTAPFKLLSGRTASVGRKRLLSAAAAQELAAHWPAIAQKAHNPATRDLAVNEADKLLDAALCQLDLPGQTMGERLKAAQGLFPDHLYNQIWQAHKLRNRLAHEVGVQVGDGEANAALSTFQWALRELGVFI